MSIRLETETKVPIGMAVLIAVQFACVIFFLTDVLADYRAAAPGDGLSGHLNIEALASFSLLAAIVVEVRFLFVLLRRKAHLERNLTIASTAVHDVIAAHFETWKLSPAETDVANFLVKGLEISQIAEMRGCAEGTVKAHLNAIYRKSDTRNRGELLSVVIDSLLGASA
ncbi:helix-turn-helix transcriptional regulator [Sulfitobacter sp. SK011]|uniref:helix-turn-helix transcriptional regulator n=1 Tax=Sulfitobacter sp. SK011 TaxID=1389004 RepID=UPI000E0B273C|nr:helix-turn-helix transcriptional regulator [Sulfitobacter sp. SK011]AXI42716.1 helix-turn-helix transcriptional regulator [Sulfitobacter sp. SK011]